MGWKFVRRILKKNTNILSHLIFYIYTFSILKGNSSIILELSRQILL